MVETNEPKTEAVISFLRNLSHEIAPVEKTVGIITSALDDDDVTKEELKALIIKAHDRLLKIQKHILAKVNSGDGGFQDRGIR